MLEQRGARCWGAAQWGMGMGGCRVSGFQAVKMPGCRELEAVAFWGAGIRTAGCKHLQHGPEHTREAADGEGGRAVGRLLAQAQLAQQLPHHRRQLEPVACGEEKLGGTRPCPGCHGGGRVPLAYPRSRPR